MIFVDTGAWFAAVVSADANHNAATAWLRANREPLFTTDFIIDETLTLLRIRRYPELALDLGQQFFDGPIATVHYITLRKWPAPGKSSGDSPISDGASPTVRASL